jgi:ribosomal protein L11 methylase PrmA
LSGILLEQRQDVTAAYERCGLKLVESEIAGEWALLVFEKRGKVE